MAAPETRNGVYGGPSFFLPIVSSYVGTYGIAVALASGRMLNGYSIP